MAQTLNSLDNILTSYSIKGGWPIFYSVIGAANSTTAATTSSGYVTGQRNSQTIALPTLGSGVTGAYLTYCRIANVASVTTVTMGLEYLLGTLTISGNSYSDGVAMPTKTVKGTSVVTAASMVLAVITTTLVATNPVITFTYTNQDGTAGRSGTITIPTNAVINSAFLLTPHLQAGDTGIRDLSALSTSAGTGGVIKIYGVLPLSSCSTMISNVPITPDPLTVSEVPYLIESTDTIGIYRFGSASAMTTPIFIVANFVAEY